jgi:hypothetical protein
LLVAGAPITHAPRPNVIAEQNKANQETDCRLIKPRRVPYLFANRCSSRRNENILFVVSAAAPLNGSLSQFLGRVSQLTSEEAKL